MAIERMDMMNLVGHLDDMDHILRDMILAECFQPVHEVQQHHIASTLDELSMSSVNPEDWVKSLSGKWEYRDAQLKLELLMERLKIPKRVNKHDFQTNYQFADVESDINVMFERFAGYLKRIESLEKEQERISRMRVMSILKDVGLDFGELEAMVHFGYRLGAISREHRAKLALNYENISAAVIHVGMWKNKEIYLILYPKALEQENIQILRSIDFEEYPMPEEYLQTPSQCLEKVEVRLSEITLEMEELQAELERFRNAFEAVITDYYSKIRMEETLLEIRGMVTVTRNFFFVSGWVPIQDVRRMEELGRAYGDRVILSFGSDRQVDPIHTRPTQLKNHWLVRPFEVLVKTYGTPSYSELDPTWFVAVTYMILFGMMFGDLGQGFLLFLGGLLVAKRFSPVGGGILSRIGLSSMAFGFIYDSLFGIEHIISHWTAAMLGPETSERLHFHSMENITSILLISVAMGVALLVVSYGLSIFNRLKIGDIKEAVFGRNGVAGLLLYIVLLGVIYGTVEGTMFLPTGASVFLIFFLTGIMIIREPLDALLKNHRPLIHESIGMFTVEAFFETFEVYLGYLSNTLSFVRVGAFALNHIGLFMAFHIIAKMLNNPIGDISMFLIGNIIVIALEGMIVMIQGMRLLYYEIFSKYYTGDGMDFKAITLDA